MIPFFSFLLLHLSHTANSDVWVLQQVNEESLEQKISCYQLDQCLGSLPFHNATGSRAAKQIT